MNIACKVCKQKSAIKYNNLFDNRHGYSGKFTIYSCTNCGFMQTQPQLSFRKLLSIYTTYYPKRDSSIKDIVNYSNNIPSEKEIYNSGLSTTCHFQTKKNQKVLDVGCGTCQSLLEIKKMGGEAWGIDVDKNSQNVAKKLKLKFKLGTIHKSNLPKNYFDLITASQVLEHEPNPIMFLKKCKKLLKKNGKIILSFPNTDAVYAKIWRKNWLHWHIPYHLNHFNKKSIKILMDKSNLKIDSIKTITPNLWTILQIRSFLNNKKEGERDPMWDGKAEEVVKNKKNIVRNTISRILPILNNFLFINRLLDYLGLGESFVITLTDKQYGSS